MADKIDYYNIEKTKLENSKSDDENVDETFKHFGKIHTGKILDDMGLIRYCCRRSIITNVDMMDII
jgi:DNA-directed RNA polymerase subunit N (RpoN/RPB10)